jgi:hypothetical protein
MTYNEVIKKLESIGIAINYDAIEVEDLNSECEDQAAFEESIREDK